MGTGAVVNCLKKREKTGCLWNKDSKGFVRVHEVDVAICLYEFILKVLTSRKKE